MHEINVEIINNVAYIAAPDLIKLCEQSITAPETPFNLALKCLAEQIKAIETEAHDNVSKKSASEDQRIFAPLG